MSASDPRYELAPNFHVIIDNQLHDIWPFGPSAVHNAPHRVDYSDQDAQAVCDMLNAQLPRGRTIFPNPAEHPPECNCEECQRLSTAGIPYGFTDRAL